MITILEMPEAPKELGEWLDRHLVSDSLAGIVDELSAIHGAPEETLTLEDGQAWLGEDADAVFERGLGTLSRDRLRELLRRPALLLPIQELVLIDGGAHWNQYVEAPPPMRAVHGSRPRPAPQSTSWRGKGRLALTVLPLAFAASLGLFMLRDTLREDPQPLGTSGTVTRGIDGEENPLQVTGRENQWGWSKDDLIPGSAPPADVAGALAKSLDDWFEVTKTAHTDAKLIQLRASELWAGCDRVLAHSFDGLAPETRQGIHDAVSKLQAGLSVTLKELRATEAATDRAAAAATAKRSADALVTEAMQSLRAIR